MSRLASRSLLFGVGLALLCSAVGIASGPAAALRERASTISARIDAVPAEYRSAVTTGLDRVENAVKAERHYLALFELERPFEMQSAFEFSSKRADITTTDAFLEEWKRVGAPPAPTAPAMKGPIIVQALATSAEARGPATYHASLPYSEDSGVSSGLFYLGESAAMYGFAKFCRSVEWPAVAAAPSLRSIAKELDAIDTEVAKAYGAAEAAQRAAFINVNVTLKVARETNGRGHYAAALLQYLLARYRFAVIGAPAAAAADLHGRIDSARASFANSKVDHSVAEFFLQLAAAQMATDTPGPRAAVVILDHVLPAYQSVVSR